MNDPCLWRILIPFPILVGQPAGRTRATPGGHRFATPRMRNRRWMVAGLAFVLSMVASRGPAAERTMSLAGTWRFALDRGDAGVSERWFARDLEGGGSLRLPGSLQEQGHGDAPSVATEWMGSLSDRSFFTEAQYAPYREPANFKFPYWLTPTRYYSGAAWYQREVVIPEGWSGRRVILRLERPHWGTTVWLNEERLGTGDSLAVPHTYDLGAAATPGKHRLTVRVDNRYLVPVGVNSHSVSDHTQGNWNGIVGSLSLESTPPVWIEDLRLVPDVTRRRLVVRGTLGLRPGEPAGRAALALEIRPWQAGRLGRPLQRLEIVVDGSGAASDFQVDMALDPRIQPWDEFQPALYRVTARLANGAERTEPFGLREVAVAGRQITINGRPVFLRGTLECCIFPKTGYPPTEVEAWRRLLRVARAHGLNHLRFHSWTPPRAAFEAADELGFYLYVECPTWANFDTTVGDGRPVDAWIVAEGDRILREYGNHPSFILLSYGNEPGGKSQERWLGDLVRRWQAQDRRRLYSSGAGWPMIPENDVHITPNARAYPVTARLGETAGDYREWHDRQTAPILSHEIGQYCVFPNLDEIPKYSGWLQARNFEIVRDFLARNGLSHQARSFLLASGRFQTLFYKDEIEACLRTPDWAGFELLDLHDFPGQGTALVGVLDPFWGEKGYVTPTEFRRFCGDTVPLARLPKRVWTTDETFRATVDVAHFAARDRVDGVGTWRIRDAGGRTLARGEWPAKTLVTGRLQALGEVTMAFPRAMPATALNLEVTLGSRRIANDWNFWVYPSEIDETVPAGVTVCHEFDDEARQALAGGGRVLWLADPRTVAGRTVGRFDPIFWNRMWFPTQPQHTLGLLLNPKHPALAGFPTAFHSDWQWQDLHNHSKPMWLGKLPGDLRPVIQVIDDWNTCRKLGLVFEGRVGPGRLLVCSIDLRSDLARRPAARQLRRSLLDYAAGPKFRPTTELDPGAVKAMFRDLRALEKLGARVVRVDSEQSGYPASLVLDGDPGTFWHSRWGDGATAHPHEIVIGFEHPATLLGITVLPRQDGNRNGWIRELDVYVTNQDGAWGEPVARGPLGADPGETEIRFARPVTGRFLRLVAVSGFEAQPFASLAELDVVTTENP